MKRLLFIPCLVFTLCGFSQESLLYLELGGAGPLVSVNYERQITPKSPFNLRAGLGYVVTWDYGGVTVPTGIYFLEDLGNQNYLELGINYTFLFESDKEDTRGFFLPAIGYRKYFLKNNGFLKITFNPVFFNDDPIRIIPWGGISYGFRF